MKTFAVQIKINPNLHLRDPQSTELGRRIIEYSVKLIDEYGLEGFTFKKLSKAIDSNEPSIYRYFENKHQLFVYLLNWYWEWLIIRIDINTLNVQNPLERLKIALNIIVDSANRNTEIEFVDEDILHKIVVREGAKGYHHKGVDEYNQEGFYLAYKQLCESIADILLEINPEFPYPRALASTLIESANNNLYFARHLPRLTDLNAKDGDLSEQVKEMIIFFTMGLIQGTPLKSNKEVINN
ncbi:MAG: TetR/AcrR family transcriptional regulator [Bacteroidia bacterium]|nr:TetR/AcrR family transcriptional regulator [Bacteroidia bacterium]